MVIIKHVETVTMCVITFQNRRWWFVLLLYWHKLLSNLAEFNVVHWWSRKCSKFRWMGSKVITFLISCVCLRVRNQHTDWRHCWPPLNWTLLYRHCHNIIQACLNLKLVPDVENRILYLKGMYKQVRYLGLWLLNNFRHTCSPL